VIRPFTVRHRARKRSKPDFFWVLDCFVAFAPRNDDRETTGFAAELNLAPAQKRQSLEQVDLLLVLE
jgi:hypothetical protein